MTVPANQHIEIEGAVLRTQITAIREASAAFDAAAKAVAPPLPADAFGAIARGILAPAANALAERSRELVSTAHDLAERMADGAEGALTGFSQVEQTAVDTFSRDQG